MTNTPSVGNIQERHIRVFLSSTFEDMQDERNALIQTTFPYLRQVAARRDVIVSIVDLRWGITEEESRQGHVLELCFKEIEHCVPFFVGIIGGRYGWIPEKEQISPSTLETFPIVYDYLSRELSVTEMEMQFGVLEKKERTNAFFYLNSTPHADEDPEKQEKLERLKKRVVHNERYPVAFYTDTDSLQDKVKEDFLKLLDQLFPETERAPYEDIQIHNNVFVREHARHYVEVDRLLTKIDDLIGSSKGSQLGIVGECGMGKSALLSAWTRTRGDRMKIVFCEMGAFKYASNDKGIQDYLVRQVASLYGFPEKELVPSPGTSPLEHVLNLVSTAGDSTPLVLVLDGVDRLEKDDLKLLLWLPVPLRGIHYIVSTRPGDRTHEVLLSRKVPSLELKELDRRQRKKVTEGYLGSHSKKLETGRVNAIAAYPLCGKPIILISFLDELIHHSTFKLLDNNIRRLGEAAVGIHPFYTYIIDSFLSGIPEAKRGQAEDFLTLIGLCETGIEEQAVMELTGASQVDWSAFFCSFGQYLMGTSGLLSFSNPFAQEIIRESLMPSRASRTEQLQEKLVAYLEKESTGKIGPELLCQYEKMGDGDRMYRYIIRPDVFAYYIDREDPRIIRAWNNLLENDKDKRYSLSACLDLILQEDPERQKKLLDEFAEFASVVVLNIEVAEKAVQEYVKIAGDEDGFLADRAHLEIASMRGDYKEALQAALRLLRQTEEKDPDNFRARVNILERISRLYGSLTEYRKALEYINQSITLYSEHIVQPPYELGFFYQERATLYSNLGDYKRAQGEIETAKELIRRAFGEGPQVAIVYMNEGNLSIWMGQRLKAYKLYKKALVLLERCVGRLHPQIASCYLGMAIAMEGEDERYSTEALRCYREALSVLRMIGQGESLQAADAYTHIGIILCLLGQNEEGADMARRGLQLMSKHNHESELIPYFISMGDALVPSDEGFDYYHKAEDLALQYRDRTPPAYLNHIWMTLCAVYSIYRCDYQTAEKYGKMALESQLSDENIAASDIMMTFTALGMSCLKSQRYKESKSYYEQALQYVDKLAEGEKSQMMMDIYFALAQCEVALMNPQKALDYASRSEKYAIQEYGRGKKEVAKAWVYMGESYHFLNEHDQAIRYLSKGLKVLEENGLEDELNVVAYTLWATSLHLQGQFSKAVRVNKRSLEVIARVYGEVSDQYALAYARLGHNYVGLSKWENAILCFRHFMEIVESIPNYHKDIHYLNALRGISNAYWNARQDEMAFASIDDALALSRSLLGGKSLRDVRFLLDKAYMYGRTSRREEEREQRQLARALALEIVGEDSEKAGKIASLQWKLEPDPESSAFKEGYRMLNQQLAGLLG